MHETWVNSTQPYIPRINIAMYYNGIPFRIYNPRSKGDFSVADVERQRQVDPIAKD